MRRKDRQITDDNVIDEIILQCDVCRLGFVSDGMAYILPLNFGFENKDGSRIFYFHSATEGKKISLIKSAPPVSFEMDTDHLLNSADVACGFSYRFKSVMGTGRITVLEEADKPYALDRIMEHYRGEKSWNYSEEALKSVCVYKLEVDFLSCKAHK